MLYDRLAGIVAAGRISHAWLLTGRPEQALEQAVLLAQALLCHNDAPGGQPCGQCPSCRKIAAGNHPDLQLILPRGASVKIDQTRAMQYMANLESYEGGRRAVIIHNAHTMPPAAANSLLKILEEPRNGLFLILTAPLGDSLLETILSRVVWVRLPENLPPGEADSIYAEEYLPELQKERELAELMRAKCRRLFELLSGDGASLVVMARSFKEDKQRSITVKRQMRVFLDELLACLHEQAVVNVRRAAGEQVDMPLSGRLVFDKNGALQAAALVEDARRDIDGNVNGALVMSVLFLQLHGIAVGC